MSGQETRLAAGFLQGYYMIEQKIQTISTLAKGRKFQLWRYYVSHRTLLIRSPKVDGTMENIDIVFSDVSYISARTSYEAFSVSCGSKDDHNLVEARLCRPLRSKEHVFCLTGDSWRDYIVAIGVYPSINSDSLHATPDLPFFDPYVSRELS